MPLTPPAQQDQQKIVVKARLSRKSVDFDTSSESYPVSNTANREVYREKRGSKFVETIIIYPVNTSNKQTNTDDVIISEHITDDVFNWNQEALSPAALMNPSLLVKLRQMDNPLLLIYESFKEMLPEHARARLLAAAAGEVGAAASSMVNKLFLVILKELEIIRGQAAAIELELGKCEDLSQSLVVYAGTSDVNDEHFQYSVESLLMYANHILLMNPLEFELHLF